MEGDEDERFSASPHPFAVVVEVIVDESEIRLLGTVTGMFIWSKEFASAIQIIRDTYWDYIIDPTSFPMCNLVTLAWHVLKSFSVELNSIVKKC